MGEAKRRGSRDDRVWEAWQARWRAAEQMSERVALGFRAPHALRPLAAYVRWLADTGRLHG